jgi:hypothetical protein
MNELGQQLTEHVEKERLKSVAVEESIRRLCELREKAKEVVSVDPLYKKISEPDPIHTIPPNYHRLAGVYSNAIDQAATGKGRERHASNEPFEEQLICLISRHLGENAGLLGGPLFQVIKKAFEVPRLPTKEAKLRELYGVMNYAAAAAILAEET